MTIRKKWAGLIGAIVVATVGSISIFSSSPLTAQSLPPCVEPTCTTSRCIDATSNGTCFIVANEFCYRWVPGLGKYILCTNARNGIPLD